jgi:hypothetical protein
VGRRRWIEPSAGRRSGVAGAALAATSLVALIHLTPPTLFEGMDWLQLPPARQYMAEALRAGRLRCGTPRGAPAPSSPTSRPRSSPPNLLRRARPVGGVGAAGGGRYPHLLACSVSAATSAQPWTRWLCAALFVSGEPLWARSRPARPTALMPSPICRCSSSWQHGCASGLPGAGLGLSLRSRSRSLRASADRLAVVAGRRCSLLGSGSRAGRPATDGGEPGGLCVAVWRAFWPAPAS